MGIQIPISICGRRAMKTPVLDFGARAGLCGVSGIGRAGYE